MNDYDKIQSRVDELIKQMPGEFAPLVPGRVVDVLTTTSPVSLRGFARFAAWANGWLPGGWRIGTSNGRWRVFRAWT